MITLNRSSKLGFIVATCMMLVLIGASLAQQKTGAIEELPDLFNEKKEFELLSGIPRIFKNTNYTKDISLQEQRLLAAEKAKNHKSIAVVSNNLGLMWLKRGDHHKAIDYFLKSLALRKAMDDKSGMAVIAGEIGFVYQQLKNYDKSLQYYYNAYEVSFAVKEFKKVRGNDYKPEVSISTQTQNDKVIIKIRDNGSGIPDEIKEKIFNPFFSTKPTGDGTGIGLSLSYDIIIHGHGGESKESEFTEFIIILPA